MIRFATAMVLALLGGCTLSLPELPPLGSGGGGDGRRADVGDGGAGDGTITSIDRAKVCLGTAVADVARNAEEITFNAGLSGGAHTWIFNAGEVGKGLGAFCGDKTFDSLVLSQVRTLLRGDKANTTTGGFEDTKQLGATTMLLLAKSTPRVWSRLSADEQSNVTLLVKAALFASAFTTSDENPYIKASQAERAIDGQTNTGRSRHNIRAGAVGTVIVATRFLGLQATRDALSGFDFDAFVAELDKAGLTNPAQTFRSAGAPDPSEIEATLHQPYAHFSVPLDKPTELVAAIAAASFGKTVSCGLNAGAGVADSKGKVGGHVVRNCATLPNKSFQGMLSSFDTIDAGGPRSSAGAAYEQWYPLVYAHLALLLLDSWDHSSAASDALELMRIGAADLAFKLSPDSDKGGGYLELRNGSASSTPKTSEDQSFGYAINFDVWRVIDEVHQAMGH
ncbi:MAG: hypothetical protein KC503_31330 [Myxococcales bacterium]|nr:hypothetical protein [Myxococcales bacterium]